jgi:outer membrane receptor protein involved in Fe transport
LAPPLAVLVPSNVGLVGGAVIQAARWGTNKMKSKSGRAGLRARDWLIATVSVLAMAGGASAQTAPATTTHRYDIPAQDAVGALQAFARQSDRQILFPYEAASGHRTPAIRGEMTEREALARLAESAGLEVSSDDGRTITLRPKPAAPQPSGGPAEPGSAVTVEELVVTANRREQQVKDVPMSVAAVSGVELERAGVETLLDLGHEVPGLTVTESGPGQNRIFLRGVANGNSSTSLVGVYVDETPVTGSSLGQLDLQLVDLQRVEVLRGPQGTLYGQGSAGGAVRFITNDPQLDDQASGWISATGYGTHRGDFSEELRGVVNVPLGDTFAVRVSGILAQIGGWIDQPDAGREDINDQNLGEVRVKALWRPTDRLKVIGTATVHRNHGDGLTAGADENGDIFFLNGDPQAKEHLVDNYEIYNGTVTYDLDWATLLSSTSYIRSHKDVAGISVKLGTFESFNQDLQDNEVFTQELRLTSNGKGPVNWVAGVFYDDETLDRLLTLNQYVSGAPIGVVPLPTIDTSRSWSVYGDASYDITDRLQLGAGARYFHDARTSYNGAFTLDGTFESFDPRFYASYALTPDIKLYANVAKGFRSGGFLGDGTIATFGPETVWSYEAGAKGSTGPVRWELTGFYGRYTAIQTFVVTSTIVGGLINAGDADIWGADWLVAIDPTDNLTLEASGNFTHTEFVSILPGAVSNIVGDKLDFIPAYSFALSAEYRFHWAAEAPGFFRVDYNQIGPAPITDHSVPIVDFETDTLHFLNARLGVSHGNLRAELFGRNLLDENGMQDPLAAFGFGSRPRPRVIGVELGAAF